MPGFNNAISKLILSMKMIRYFQIIQIEIFTWVTSFLNQGVKKIVNKEVLFLMVREIKCSSMEV